MFNLVHTGLGCPVCGQRIFGFHAVDVVEQSVQYATEIRLACQEVDSHIEHYVNDAEANEVALMLDDIPMDDQSSVNDTEEDEIVLLLSS